MNTNEFTILLLRTTKDNPKGYMSGQEGYVAIDPSSGGYPYCVGENIFKAKQWQAEPSEQMHNYAKMFGLQQVWISGTYKVRG